MNRVIEDPKLDVVCKNDRDLGVENKKLTIG